MVNAKLWTLPAEYYCYLVTALLIVTGLLFKRPFYLGAITAWTITAVATSFLGDFGVTPRSIYSTPVVVYYFLVGALFFHLQDRIVRRWSYFFGASAPLFLRSRSPRVSSLLLSL
ncbi:hypothetical protein [Bradyrhizobium sp. B117]|uniref:hypothetical protein n=1 Tax=Bradyrhizobium sp. B117 TaxID=3140246 RepID=UPI0031834F33